jgi:hypothetical protein
MSNIENISFRLRISGQDTLARLLAYNSPQRVMVVQGDLWFFKNNKSPCTLHRLQPLPQRMMAVPGDLWFFKNNKSPCTPLARVMSHFQP